MVKAFASHRCGLGSIHGSGVTRWLRFSSLLRGVFLPVSPSTKTNIFNSNPTWKRWTRRAISWNVTAKLFNLIIIVIFIIFICPILPIVMLSAPTPLAILQVLEFSH